LPYLGGVDLIHVAISIYVRGEAQVRISDYTSGQL